MFLFFFPSNKSSSVNIWNHMKIYFAQIWLEKGPSLSRQCSWDKCFPHFQASHVELGARSHGGSLLQDKALGAGRHWGPCSRFAWLHVKWVFAYWEDQDPPGGRHSTQPPLNSTWGHTYTRLSVGAFMIRNWCLYENTAVAIAQFHVSLFKRGETEVEDE